MKNQELAIAVLGMFLIGSFGCTASFRNEAAPIPLPPDPPQPPMGAKAMPKAEVFSLSIPKNSIFNGSNALSTITAKPNTKRADDVTLVSEPQRKISINETEAILADLFDAKKPELSQVYYFYSPLCPYSANVKAQAESLEREYANSTEWHKVNVLSPEGFAFFERTIAEKGLFKNSMVVPMLFFGNYKLSGQQEIEELLPKVLKNSSG